jgi:hypothetical protein
MPIDKKKLPEDKREFIFNPFHGAAIKTADS